MKVSRAALFLLVRAGPVRVRAQIVSESDMTLDLRRLCVEKMKLYDANAGLIVKTAIAPARYANRSLCHSLPSASTHPRSWLSLAKSVTSGIRSMIGLAASPGTDVEPM
jgi:hypothetical protein